MEIIKSETSKELGEKAADMIASSIDSVIAKNGRMRLLVSTGASQFDMFEALVRKNIDWSKVEMFHLDEYINLPQTHPASFIKYLKERFISKADGLTDVHFVDVSIGVSEIIAALTAELNKAPVDLGIIGIGENAHIAFNDPPADFDTDDAFKVVALDDACRRQQFGEGWFPSFDDVPKEAISMTVKQIMKCRKIISVVPHAVKADAVYKTLNAAEPTPMIPASILKTHPDWTLFLDRNSAGRI